MLKSLLCLLLLASPLFAQDKPGATVSPNKVKGVTMPASIIVNDTDVTKRIVPVFDNPAAVLDVKYKVISSGETDPVARPKGSGKDFYLEIDVPKQKEAILVFVYVLYGGDKPWVTEPAQTIVEWGSGLPPPVVTPPVVTPPVVTPPVNPPGTPAEVFASVKNVQAWMILNMAAVTPEIGSITQFKTEFQKVFGPAGTGNKWLQFDIKSITPANAKVLGLTAQTPLPVVCLLDMNTSPPRLIAQVPVTLTGNVTQTATNLLVSIAQALTKK